MRKVWDIHGGIHPPENKIQSLDESILEAPIAPQLVLPLSQHIGAPARACVKVGQQVLKGQCIAEAVGPVSVPIHAPTSGTITAIEKRPIAHPSGLEDNCIILETDGNDQWRERNPVNDYSQLDKATLVNMIRSAGIAGMGGAGFPTSIKLNTRDNVVIDTLIINGTECEPYITADHALMREQADNVATGIAILVQLIKPVSVLIGIEDNKPDVIDGIKAAIAKHDLAKLSGKTTTAEVITFPTKYPSGGEKQLIQILTGKEVPSGGLPADLGIVCQNIGTAVAIKNAICDDEPLISRITTVTGDAVMHRRNYHVLLGTPVEFLLKQSNYQQDKSGRLVMGGPMMGFALSSTAVPIVKTTNCILAPTETELPTPPPAQACIRCGMCAEACPASLLPQQLYWFAQGKELDKLEEHNIADCIECGACSYVCPSNIPLVQYYRASKADIRQRKIDHQNAEAARIRFEARQERLERLEDEKIAARKARQAAAKIAAEKRGQTDERSAEVQAAIERVSAKKTPASETATVDMDDPIQRALARRQAQQSGEQLAPAEQEALLVKAVETSEKRQTKARAKLAEAEADNDVNVPAFTTGVEKSAAKYQQAVAALAEFHQTQENKPPATSAADEDDPVARAVAKRAEQQAEDASNPASKFIRAVESAEQRVAKATSRLADAKANNDENVDAFAKGLEKAQDKLAASKQALSEFQADEQT